MKRDAEGEAVEHDGNDLLDLNPYKSDKGYQDPRICRDIKLCWLIVLQRILQELQGQTSSVKESHLTN